VSRLCVYRILALAGLSLLAADLYAQKIYSWVDEDGKTHYGDSIPPEYAKQDRKLLNDQGVVVGTEQGEITEEERAEMEAKARAEEERRSAAEEQRRRDQMLLDTYIEASDIEKLRDRRLELLDAQIKVFEIYLNNLRKRLDDLLETANSFAPRNQSEGAPPLPANLSLDIERTRSSIRMYEQRLQENRANQQAIREDFQKDIDRFRKLKGA
jgi:hypothetical protein